MSTLGNKKVELFDMGAGASGEPTAEENVQVASGQSLCLLFYSMLPRDEHIKMLSCLKLKLIFYVIAMSNQELVDAGMKRMDETDQAIEPSKQVSYRKKHVCSLL